MRISEVVKIIEAYAPTELAEDFDNVGLLVGDGDTEVTSALLTLDVDIDVAMEAQELGANLIISHHPIIFNPLRRITSDTPDGRCLLFLIQNGISVYSAHTNLDSVAGGLNDLISALLGLRDTVPLTNINDDNGLGRIGILSEALTMKQLSQRLCDIFSMDTIRFTGYADDIVSRVALCSGGGSSLLKNALDSLADVYITGDLKYNDVRNAVSEGMNIIEVGHYDSEILTIRLFDKILGGKVKTFPSKANVNFFSTL